MCTLFTAAILLAIVLSVFAFHAPLDPKHPDNIFAREMQALNASIVADLRR